MAEPRSIGEALDLADNIGRRSLKEWSEQVAVVMNVVRQLAGAMRSASRKEDEELLEVNYARLEAVYRGLDEATRSLTRTKDELETRTAYTELQNKLLEGWPKPAVADRLFYLGGAMLGGGGLAFALLGSAGVLDYAALWVAGIVSLGLSIFFLNKYDTERAAHFAQVRNRVR